MKSLFSPPPSAPSFEDVVATVLAPTQTVTVVTTTVVAETITETVTTHQTTNASSVFRPPCPRFHVLELLVRIFWMALSAFLAAGVASAALTRRNRRAHQPPPELRAASTVSVDHEVKFDSP
jgi:hypothetical protein